MTYDQQIACAISLDVARNGIVFVRGALARMVTIAGEGTDVRDAQRALADAELAVARAYLRIVGKEQVMP
jgi:hypothetical protein